MENFNLWEFIGITVILFGGAAFLMGQAIADTWRSIWWNVPYGILLAAGNHFIDAALFTRSWTDWVHYLLNLIVLLVISFLAYRLTYVRKMILQYPWIYEQQGLLSYREKKEAKA